MCASQIVPISGYAGAIDCLALSDSAFVLRLPNKPNQFCVSVAVDCQSHLKSIGGGSKSIPSSIRKGSKSIPSSIGKGAKSIPSSIGKGEKPRTRANLRQGIGFYDARKAYPTGMMPNPRFQRRKSTYRGISRAPSVASGAPSASTLGERSPRQLLYIRNKGLMMPMMLMTPNRRF